MRSRNVVIGVVSSVVVLALAVGLLLLVESVGDDVELPDRVDGLVAADLEAAYPSADVPPETVARQRSLDETNADGFSDAFDGADADARSYVDPDSPTDSLVGVVAVAADAGPLVPQDGFVDPEQLGFALPLVERVTDGDVECLLVRNQPPRAGSDVQPDQALPDAHLCQRRSGALTVRVRSTSSDTDAVVDLVDALWDELG